MESAYLVPSLKMCPISTALPSFSGVAAARTAFALDHVAQIGDIGHLEVGAHVQSGEVMIEFVGSAHQVLAPAQSLVHHHHEVCRPRPRSRTFPCSPPREPA